MIPSLPPSQRLSGEVDLEEELLEALNKIHRVKERQWLLQAYPDGHDGSTVDNISEKSSGIHFAQRYTTDATPTLLAALIIGFAKKHGIQSEAPILIPKDIHTIVDHFDLNPTLHVSILCPQCYALYPFTAEALTEAENARKHNASLPRSSTVPEAVPEVPALNYDQVPDGWVGANPTVEPDTTSQASDSELSEASFSSRASSIVNPNALPPVLRPAAGFLYNKDQEFENLKSKLLDLSARAPSLSRLKKVDLQALCQDLNILYGSKETNKVLVQRLLLYRQENGANDNAFTEELRYGKLKRNFEEEELSKATLMSWPLKLLEQLCREYQIPPFNSSNPRTLKKEDMVRRLLLWASDLENMGPGHARSTPVFERINHFLQEVKKNGHLGEVEATMMASYGRMANLQILLDRYPELREEIEEALAVLKDIEREDHRGIFAGTDLSAWSSTEFKKTPITVEEATLDRIVNHLCDTYHLDRLHWDGKLARCAQELDGVALGRVIYSPRLRENSVVFRSEGNILAGTISKVITHAHPHPATQKMAAFTFLEVIAMDPISEGKDDLYRALNCGWLCSRTNTNQRVLTIPLGDVISHFVRTDLTLLVNETAVTHVYPVPKIFRDNESGMPTMMQRLSVGHYTMAPFNDRVKVIMTSKVRIISADTWRTRRLEEQAALKHAEVVRLRDVVRQLHLQFEKQTDAFRLKTELDAATNLIHQLRLQILTTLGCEISDEQCLEAISTNEEKSFWSLVDEVKSKSQNSCSPTHPSDHLAEGHVSAPGSSLTLVQQCTELNELVGKLGSGRHENALRKQCLLGFSFNMSQQTNISEVVISC
ncbi:hypothetical protein EV360DRAFT_68405 [Lentinula raphanica]|nr:hypothetical protein EV360DRAFT_68405 [Lentinula raphanica]